MAELGWVGVLFPERFGGAGMGLAELAVVLEELGRTLAPEPFLSTALLGGQAVLLAGNDAQQKAWLEGVVNGEKFLALAQQERTSRFDLHRVATRAEEDGQGYRIRGEKIAVLDGGVADAIVVVARTSGDDDDPSGITLFLVPAGTPGLRVERQSRVDSRGAALVHLEDCAVGAETVIGEVGGGLAVLEAVCDRATVGLCAEMLGSMSEAFERTLEYLKNRLQFGVPIGSFQALKHRAAELFIQIELCRSAVMAAARGVDEGNAEAAKLVSLAKARCSEAAILVANEAVQMHGGIGMTDEHEIGFFMKRARVAELTLGDASWHRARWARIAGY
jgi:alkylation response protein AidB-like acyl-CoA dehydrogenase